MSIIFNCINEIIRFLISSETNVRKIYPNDSFISIQEPFISTKIEQNQKYSKSEFVKNENKYRYERLEKDIEYRKSEILYFKRLNRDTTQIVIILEKYLDDIKQSKI